MQTQFRTTTNPAAVQSYTAAATNPLIVIDTRDKFIVCDITDPPADCLLRTKAREIWEEYAEGNKWWEQAHHMIAKLHRPGHDPITIGAVDGDPDEIQTFI